MTPAPRPQIVVTAGAPCACYATPTRTRDGDEWTITCPQCGREWRIGLEATP